MSFGWSLCLIIHCCACLDDDVNRHSCVSFFVGNCLFFGAVFGHHRVFNDITAVLHTSCYHLFLVVVYALLVLFVFCWSCLECCHRSGVVAIVLLLVVGR